MKSIIDEFNSEKHKYDRLASKLAPLIQELLRESDIRIHQITQRVKETNSLSNKIKTKEGQYKQLCDITDIVGIRIITYLDSDVDIVSEMIRSEFEIDLGNSIDKRKHENDVFGYRSLHYVASFNNSRCKLTEFKSLKGLKFEVQIRSILQHAWTEIEHDLGYKSKISVPDNFIRAFNRLSALLETADIEFDRLKKDLKTYESTLPNLIATTPNDIEINQASLLSYAQNDITNQEASKIIQNIANCGLNNFIDTTRLLNMLDFLELETIDELNKATVVVKEKYLEFIAEIYKQRKERIAGTSILTPLHHLCTYLALEKGVFNEMSDVYNMRDIDEFSKLYTKINSTQAFVV